MNNEPPARIGLGELFWSEINNKWPNDVIIILKKNGQTWKCYVRAS